MRRSRIGRSGRSYFSRWWRSELFYGSGSDTSRGDEREKKPLQEKRLIQEEPIFAQKKLSTLRGSLGRRYKDTKGEGSEKPEPSAHLEDITTDLVVIMAIADLGGLDRPIYLAYINRPQFRHSYVELRLFADCLTSCPQFSDTVGSSPNGFADRVLEKLRVVVLSRCV